MENGYYWFVPEGGSLKICVDSCELNIKSQLIKVYIETHCFLFGLPGAIGLENLKGDFYGPLNFGLNENGKLTWDND